MSEKEITLSYNGNEIKINITKDYKKAVEAIKEKLSIKDIKKMVLSYEDEDKDLVTIDYDLFEDAYNASKWILKIREDEEN